MSRPSKTFRSSHQVFGELEVELMGGGEESSLIECLADIIDQLKKDGWVSHREIKKQEG